MQLGRSPEAGTAFAVLVVPAFASHATVIIPVVVIPATAAADFGEAAPATGIYPNGVATLPPISTFDTAGIRNLLCQYGAASKRGTTFAIAIADTRADHASGVPAIARAPLALPVVAQRSGDVVLDAAECPAGFDGIEIKLQLVIGNTASTRLFVIFLFDYPNPFRVG